MSITRISYTGRIPGIKVLADTVAELNGYTGQVGQGEIGAVNGELFYKELRNSSSFTPVSGLEATGTIATAAVKTLNGTPVTVIAAPGAEKIVIVDEIQLFLDYAAADYVADAGEDLSFKYTGSTTIATIDTANGFLTASADAHLFAKVSVYDVDNAEVVNGFDFTAEANKGVDLTILIGEVATGDSPLKYKIKYRIVDALV